MYVWQGGLPCSGCTGCGTLTSATGTFTDGSGSSNYVNNANCEWIIAPSGATQISVTFTQFSTEPNYDFVTLRQCSGTDCTQGTKLAELSGAYASAQTFTSQSSRLHIKFTSDSDITYGGFAVSWTIGATLTPAPSSVSHTFMHNNLLQLIHIHTNKIIFWFLTGWSPVLRLHWLWRAHNLDRHVHRWLRPFKLSQQCKLQVDHCASWGSASYCYIHAVWYRGFLWFCARVQMHFSNVQLTGENQWADWYSHNSSDCSVSYWRRGRGVCNWFYCKWWRVFCLMDIRRAKGHSCTYTCYLCCKSTCTRSRIFFGYHDEKTKGTLFFVTGWTPVLRLHWLWRAHNLDRHVHRWLRPFKLSQQCKLQVDHCASWGSASYC